MNKIRSLVFLATIVSALALRADNVEDKIAANFFLPEQVKKYAEVLNLTDDQKGKLRDAYEGAQQKVEQLKEQQQADADKFNELAKQSHVDEKAIFAQGDKFLDTDREIKHLQLGLLVLIKNTLIPEQQATLNAIKALDPKIKEATKIADKWKADGRDMSKLEGMKSEFESALQSGKIKDAEAIVDRALDILNERGGK